MAFSSSSSEEICLRFLTDPADIVLFLVGGDAEEDEEVSRV